MGVVRPASRPRTPAWLPRASTLPLRMAGLPSLRLTLPPERLGALKEPLRGDELRSKLDELRLELLPTVERLGLDERLELLLKLLRLELELDERLELPLKLLRLELLEEERLLLMELLWLPPPPPRLPPLRCANAGVALSARATIASAITFEVFISLLLSLFIVFIFDFNIATCYQLPAFNSLLFLLQKYNLSPREIPKLSPIFPSKT